MLTRSARVAAVAGLLAAATEPASAFQPAGVALRAPGMRCVVQCSANRAACHAALPCASFSDSGPSPLPAARRFYLLPTTIRARGACTQRCALARYAGDAHSMSWQRLRRLPPPPPPPRPRRPLRLSARLWRARCPRPRCSQCRSRWRGWMRLVLPPGSLCAGTPPPRPRCFRCVCPRS